MLREHWPYIFRPILISMVLAILLLFVPYVGSRVTADTIYWLELPTLAFAYTSVCLYDWFREKFTITFAIRRRICGRKHG